MAKLQHISWATILLILGSTTIDISQDSMVRSETKPNSVNAKTFQLAQKNNSDDEMLDALQEREKKIDAGLDKIKKLTGTKSPKSNEKPGATDNLTEQEMIDAINGRQQKIKELQELKLLEELTKNQELLESLQSENFDIESLAELELIRNIVDNQDLSKEEMLSTLQQSNINVENLKQLKRLSKIVGQPKSYVLEDTGISPQMAFRMFTIGLPAIVLVFLIGKPIAKGVMGAFKSNYEEKFGNPKVPEGSVNLHARSFKEITLIGNKAEKINNDKFGNGKRSRRLSGIE